MTHGTGAEDAAERPLVAIYADESCLGNGREGSNPGGAAGVIEYGHPGSDKITRRDYWVSEPATTNNRMALRSEIEAFRGISRKGGGPSISRGVHQRLAVPGERHERLGVRLDGAWLEEEGRADSQSRVVDRSRRSGSRSRGELALGSRARGASAKRVRELPGDTSRARAVAVERDRGVDVQRVVGGRAHEGTHARTSTAVPGCRIISSAKAVSNGAAANPYLVREHGRAER